MRMEKTSVKHTLDLTQVPRGFLDPGMITLVMSSCSSKQLTEFVFSASGIRQAYNHALFIFVCSL